ncbi:hypothetical protein BJ165DRAFT_1608782 [Panaeolus papilionaceus]|nr:hypothetical protein BJ165DRAFT_1608782 [Panaeolus papilionaceus]
MIMKASYAIGRQEITIYVDNQSVIQAISSNTPGPAEYLKKEFHRICDTYIRLMGNANLTKPLFRIKWISAHSKVERNKKIDEDAKEAVEGRTSRDFDLPHILRRQLPVSKSNELWVTSARYDRYVNLKNDFQFKKFHRLANKLDRYKFTLLVKLRTKHLPLNDYLHKKKLICSPNYCRAHEHQRLKLHRQVQEAKDDLEKMLRNEDHTMVLLDYIETTNRFPSVELK